MPIKLEKNMPVIQRLREENILVMTGEQTTSGDTRTLKVAVVNLMPNKEATELQVLRLLSNSPLTVKVTFVRLASHQYKNVSAAYLDAYYESFDTIRSTRFDGLIITGAPVERLAYEAVDYWEELTELMQWGKTHATSSLYICWAAQAGLYYHYGIPKYEFDKKLSGVYRHRITDRTEPLVRGFDDEFWAPHSRYTGVHTRDILGCQALKILALSDVAGAYIISALDGRLVFVNGHPEYDTDTLAKEYQRDTQRNLEPALPEHYFPKDDPHSPPIARWRSQGSLLFANWLNYFVCPGARPFALLNQKGCSIASPYGTA